jgi:hypothetical protein
MEIATASPAVDTHMMNSLDGRLEDPSSAIPIPGPEASNGITPVVRKFKASDLPLPSATRSAIDGLAHTFKKKGRYDDKRKQVWAKFEAQVCLPFSSLGVCM